MSDQTKDAPNDVAPMLKEKDVDGTPLCTDILDKTKTEGETPFYAECGSEEDEDDKADVSEKKEFKPKKQTEPGLLYISHLPPDMTPLFVRKIFSQYGEVGRVYLQADKRQKKGVKPKYDRGIYEEGWVEIGCKKLARRLALSFNNTLITDGKKSKFANHLWNIKYLPRFRWRHLSDKIRMDIEKRKQRLNIELNQAKKETAAFEANVEASKNLANAKKRTAMKGEKWDDSRRQNKFKQRKTVQEMREDRKRQNPSSVSQAGASRSKIFKSILG